MILQFLRYLKKASIAFVAMSATILVLPQAQKVQGQQTPFPFKQFVKYEKNPILSPQGDSFESKGVYNPGAIMVNDTVYMFYRAQDETGQSSIGLAKSEGGINFVRNPKPAIVPEFDYELPGGCEDPRIMRIGNTYYITYTGYSANGTPSCLASSRDLVNWKKYGPIVPQKSAAIINEKINGKYWLYFGDTNMWIAHSTDMINWTVIEEPVMRPRKGYFDEGLVEPGPPPIITEDGILLIYNGNIPKKRAMELGRNKGRQQIRDYSTGWALFSIEHPTRVIARCEEPFLTVSEDFEIYGQINDVVFSEGLVKKDGKSFLYYGTADTYTGVAISEQTWQEPEYIAVSENVSKISTPVLIPQGEGFERDRLYNPATIVVNDTVFMIYRAEGEGTGTGALGLAWSKDGINFDRYENNPILKAEFEYEEYGTEDPRVIKVNDKYYMFYVGNDKKRTAGNICLAMSHDLIHWEKQGEILQPKVEWESKQIKAPAPVPLKINGKYWLYYQGEKESWKTKMGLACSDDMIHWTQASEEPVMNPREGCFDSWGVEPGGAVIIDEGILLIYAGWGGDETNRNQLGWVLFSQEDPGKIIARCEAPIVSLPNDHVFCDGLVKFKDKWHIYYGAADCWIEGIVIDFEQIFNSEISSKKTGNE